MQIQLRRGTATQWINNNPVLGQGEPAYETDTGKFKIGDGTTAYNSLPYATMPSSDVRNLAMAMAIALG